MANRTPSNYSIRGFRRSLASLDSVPQFAVLGVISGLVTGLVILAFRALMEIPLSYLLDGEFENFEALDPLLLFGLPVFGSIILAILFRLISEQHRRVGVVHVLERLGRHQGYLTWQNAVVQFLGGIVALGTGQSGGREGPAIHLGAAFSSLLGQSLKLPNNSIRVLVGCGAAAAISASFNTPIAGVIFSMEVIMLEYTIAGFIPVILASVTATLINQLVYDSSSVFQVDYDISWQSFYNLPFLILEGIVIGGLAAAYVYLIKLLYRFSPQAHWLRLLIAGLTTGLIGLMVPEVLGIGYDTVELTHNGQLAVTVLIVICILKIITSAVTVSMGVPVGVIGPTLFIGATAGGILGYVGTIAVPDQVAPQGFYVILGMGAMMGAVLQAPLAALMAVMELTQNTNIILPAMLVIIIANLTASEIFKVKSVFLTQMDILGLDYRQNPLTITLNRASVASIMSRSFEQVPRHIEFARARELISNKPTWLIVRDSEAMPSYILRTIDLISYLDNTNDDEEVVDLNAIPATRKDIQAVMLQATLSEALEKLNQSGVQALYVNRISGPMLNSVVGVLTREDIESYYQA
ncbi:MAG: chloride channel protein [Pseudomonadales bacterium]|nr:chloride channel protein [Pseudomonadales bacterium]MDG1442328.1 chloride channel protein [Pseudomonadales bacterium]